MNAHTIAILETELAHLDAVQAKREDQIRDMDRSRIGLIQHHARTAQEIKQKTRLLLRLQSERDNPAAAGAKTL